MTQHARSNTCACYDCITKGDTRCGVNGCALRFGHTDKVPHTRLLGAVRMFLRELRHTLVRHAAGEKCDHCDRGNA